MDRGVSLLSTPGATANHLVVLAAKDPPRRVEG